MHRPQRSLVVLGSVLLVYILAGISISFRSIETSPASAGDAQEAVSPAAGPIAPEPIPEAVSGL